MIANHVTLEPGRTRKRRQKSLCSSGGKGLSRSNLTGKRRADKGRIYSSTSASQWGIHENERWTLGNVIIFLDLKIRLQIQTSTFEAGFLFYVTKIVIWMVVCFLSLSFMFRQIYWNKITLGKQFALFSIYILNFLLEKRQATVFMKIF
jgi:hypothetical protein